MVIINKHSWIVVANGSECEIFSANLKDKHLVLLKQFHSLEARAHNKSLSSEKPGRVHESNSSTRHSIELKSDPQHKEKIKFIHLITDFLNDKINSQEFNSLILIASPALLGEIRKHLHKELTSIILKESNKDLIHAGEVEILKHILSL